MQLAPNQLVRLSSIRLSSKRSPNFESKTGKGARAPRSQLARDGAGWLGESCQSCMKRSSHKRQRNSRLGWVGGFSSLVVVAPCGGFSDQSVAFVSAASAASPLPVVGAEARGISPAPLRTPGKPLLRSLSLSRNSQTQGNLNRFIAFLERVAASEAVWRLLSLDFAGSPGWIRTSDHSINSRMLYH